MVAAGAPLLPTHQSGAARHPQQPDPHPFDKAAYRGRNVIERAIGRLKDGRRINTRYDKLARNFASAVAIAAILQGW